MDVVEASHLNCIKQYCENNPDMIFKMRKFGKTWTMGIFDMNDDHNFETVSDNSFLGALRLMCRIISTNKEHQTNVGLEQKEKA